MESIRKGTSKHPDFYKGRFTYDERSNSYTCPLGRVLRYKGLRRKRKPPLLIYRGQDCPHCPRRGEYTRSIQRTISWDPREFLIQRIRARLATAEGRKRYGKRKYLVEPVFGDMKENRHMGKLLLRGKRKAKGEFLLMCIVHNLRKMAK